MSNGTEPFDEWDVIAGAHKPLAFDVKDEGCQAHKDLEEPLKAARVYAGATPEDKEAQHQAYAANAVYHGLPTEDDQQAYAKEQRYLQGFRDGLLGYAGATRTTPKTQKEAHMDEPQIGPVRDPASYYIDEAGDVVYRGQLQAKSESLWPAYTYEGYYSRGLQEGFRAGQEAGVRLANDIMNCYAGPSVIVYYKALSGVPYTINSTLAPGTVVLRDKGLPTAHIYADSVSTLVCTNLFLYSHNKSLEAT